MKADRTPLSVFLSSCRDLNPFPRKMNDRRFGQFPANYLNEKCELNGGYSVWRCGGRAREQAGVKRESFGHACGLQPPRGRISRVAVAQCSSPNLPSILLQTFFLCSDDGRRALRCSLSSHRVKLTADRVGFLEATKKRCKLLMAEKAARVK